MKSFFNDFFFPFVGVIVSLAILLLVSPLILFWVGYFTGWLAKITIGAKLIAAINLTFGTSLTVDMLPMIGGCLGWIGSFFKGSSASKNK